jgi:hypothetical protein
MTDQTIAERLKALAENYERRGEAASHAESNTLAPRADSFLQHCVSVRLTQASQPVTRNNKEHEEKNMKSNSVVAETSKRSAVVICNRGDNQG